MAETIITRTSVLGLWHPARMRVDGQDVHHMEGWLQYCKHVHANPGFAREIARASSASQARDMGDERILWADLDLGKRALRVDEVEEWHERRPKALRDGLWARTKHDLVARRELMATGDTRLRYVDESAPWYEQHVGDELMHIRDVVRSRGERGAHQHPDPDPDPGRGERGERGEQHPVREQSRPPRPPWRGRRQ